MKLRPAPPPIPIVPEHSPIRRALISVWDKTGLTELATELVGLDIQLLVSAGTAAHLKRDGIEVAEISSLTGFEELLGGRVKTLHPSIYASILARPGDDEIELQQHGIDPVDLVVVDLYPFAQARAASQVPVGEIDQEVVEKIDIGGVSLLRAAAKNFQRTCVVHDRSGRDLLLTELRRNQGQVSTAVRRQLAASAMQATSEYDRQIADWMAQTTDPDELPATLTANWKRTRTLRYGENPHQQAALYLADPGTGDTGVYGASQLQGKELSYNNLQDAQAAWETVGSFDEPACVVVKHANPCAAALGTDLPDAWHRALKADRTSPFGGIVAVNRPMDERMAQALLDFGFLEVVLAPAFDQQARELLGAKRNLRLLETPVASGTRPRWQWAGSGDALLVQQTDTGAQGLKSADLQVVSRRKPTAEQLADLLFAWKIAAFVKSNAIVLANDRAVSAVGAGQMSRVFSMQIAALKAELESMDIRGHVLASDAFFPFRDGIDRAAEQGVSAVIQPGGSVRDEEVIAAADEHDMAMVFTGVRHFRH